MTPAAPKKPITSKRSPTPKRARKAAGKKTIWILRDNENTLHDEVAVYDHKEDLMFELQLNVDDYGEKTLTNIEVLECEVKQTWKADVETNIILLKGQYKK